MHLPNGWAAESPPCSKPRIEKRGKESRSEQENRLAFEDVRDDTERKSHNAGPEVHLLEPRHLARLRFVCHLVSHLEWFLYL